MMAETSDKSLLLLEGVYSEIHKAILARHPPMKNVIMNEKINSFEYYYVKASNADSKASSAVFSYFINVLTSVWPVSFITVVIGIPLCNRIVQQVRLAVCEDM